MLHINLEEKQFPQKNVIKIFFIWRITTFGAGVTDYQTIASYIVELLIK